jgi:hypothetical protein
MGPAIRIGFAIIVLTSSACADLELMPRLEEYEFDGVKLHQLVFADGDRRVTYTPPRKWEYLGSGNRFTLRPVSTPTAEAIITVNKLLQPEVFDDATKKRLCDEVLASVPSGATNLALVSQQMNPLLIERKETFLVVIHYDYYGSPYARSVMFLDRANEHVRFQLTCFRNVFPQLQKTFETSHYSWQNL